MDFVISFSFDLNDLFKDIGKLIDDYYFLLVFIVCNMLILVIVVVNGVVVGVGVNLVLGCDLVLVGVLVSFI